MRLRVARAALTLSALLVSLPALSGCGSSGGGSGSFDTFQQTAFSNPTREGTVNSFGGVTNSFILAGDSGIAGAQVEPQADVTPQGLSGATFRGFVSFPLSLPPGAFLVSATLQMTPEAYTSTPTGTEFATLGNVLVDHVDIGAALDTTDFAGGTLQSSIGTLLTSEVFGPVQMDVTNSVANDLANLRTTSEYRVYFANANDGDAFEDSVEFGGAFSKGGEARLIIVYAFVNPGIPYLPEADSQPD